MQVDCRAMSGALKMLSLVALLLGAIALGACGGGDEREKNNAYVRELNAAQEEFSTDATAVSAQKSPASIGQYRRTLRRFETAIASFTDKLRSIEVPGVVEAEHAQLVDALMNFGTDFQKVTGALNNPNARTLSEAQTAIATARQRAQTRIEAAAAAIESKLQET
jgi:outer membrane murein-binding lipoprotein Lpp